MVTYINAGLFFNITIVMMQGPNKNIKHQIANLLQVKLIRLVGMMLIVYVKEDHVKFISNVTAEQVGTGIMGMLGNKGGVAVR